MNRVWLHAILYVQDIENNSIKTNFSDKQLLPASFRSDRSNY